MSSPGEKRGQNTFRWQLLALLSVIKILCEYFGTLLTLDTKEIVGSW